MDPSETNYDFSHFPKLTRPEGYQDQYITAKIRDICREGFQSATEQLVSLALGETQDTSPAVQLRAIDTLGKYGMGRHPSILVEQGELLQIVAQVTLRYLQDTDLFARWYEDVQKAARRGPIVSAASAM